MEVLIFETSQLIQLTVKSHCWRNHWYISLFRNWYDPAYMVIF